MVAAGAQLVEVLPAEEYAEELAGSDQHSSAARGSRGRETAPTRIEW
jgi:hypothetical protein